MAIKVKVVMTGRELKGVHGGDVSEYTYLGEYYYVLVVAKVRVMA